MTGASSGIGEAVARRLDRDGWRLLLAARREDRLEQLAGSLRDARPLVLDVTADDAPARATEAVERELGGLDLLVNNAGGSWPAAFGDPEGGFENVRQTFELNFDATVRLTEALLPELRRSAPGSAVVNVSSVAARIARASSGAYSASKAALAAWSEALYLEEREHGVHVGCVLPGFIETEGFPQAALRRNPATRWIVSTPDRVADAVVDAGPGGAAERYAPRPYGVLGVLRTAVPRVVREGAARMS